jgi:hypothetical protein
MTVAKPPDSGSMSLAIGSGCDRSGRPSALERLLRYARGQR